MKLDIHLFIFRKTLFEPIPIQEEKAKSVSAASVKSKNILDIDDKPSQSSSQPTQSSTGGGSDILNELFGSTATPSKPAPTNQKSPSPLDLISELSIGTGPSIQPTPSSPTSPLSPILPTPCEFFVVQTVVLY